MAGAMRKMAVYLGLVEDERFEEYDEIDDYDEPEERSSRSGSTAHGYARPATSLRDRRDMTPAASGGGSGGSGWDHGATRGSLATVPDRAMSPLSPSAAAAGLDRITTIHPRTYNEAKQIGEAFRAGTPVIMNLSDMDDSDAKRLVDFSAGLVFGLRGSIERVTNKVFLLSPVNVSVTAEDKARMAESSFFNQS